MTFDRLRRRMKAIIWMITIVFVSSLLFAGGTMCVQNDRRDREDQLRDREDAAAAKRKAGKDDLPEDSKVVLATVELFKQKAQVTEGELNARINTTAKLSPYLKGMTPKQLKPLFAKGLLDTMVNEKLVELAATEQKLDLDKAKKEAEEQASDPRVLQQLRQAGYTKEEFIEERIKEARGRKMMETITEGAPVADKMLMEYYDMNKSQYIDPATKQPKSFESVRKQIETVLRSNINEPSILEYYEKHKPRWRKAERATVTHLMIDPRSEARTKAVTVTDAEIKSYYDQNKSNFVGDAKVSIRHIFLDPKSYAAKATATDEELQKYYDGHKDDFMRPERVTAAHLVLAFPPNAKDEDKKKLEEKCKALFEEIKKGTKFEDAVKANSTDAATKDKGGDLGVVEKGKHSPAFDAAVFSAKEGDVTPPFSDEDGWHLVKITKREEKSAAPLADVKEDVKKKVLESKADKLAMDDAKAVQAEAKSKKTDFEALAKAKSQAPSKDKGGLLSDLFLGANKDNKDVEEVGSFDYMDKEIQDALQKLKAGEVSDVVTGSKGLHILKLEKSLPPEPRPLADVRAEIVDLLREGKVEQEAVKVSEAIKAEIKAGTPFEALVPKYSDGKDKDAKGLWDGVILDASEKQTLDAKLLADVAPAGLLPDAIASALASAGTGQIVGPITHEKKDHYFHVVKRHPVEYRALDEELKKEIRFALNPSVTTEEIQAYYKEHAAEFRTPESTSAEWQVYPEKELAQEALAAARADIKAWAAQNPEKHSGEIRNREIRKVLSELKPNEFVKEPVKISMGWIVARLDKKEAGGELPLSKVEKQVRDRLLGQKKQQLYESWLEELKNQAKITKQTPSAA